jgi:hypothetical protein
MRKQKRTRAYRFSGSIRPSLRNGFTAYSALSPVTGFLATVASRKTLQDLTPAPGRQDHTPSPSASAPFVQRRIGVHRIPCRVDDVGQRPSVVQDARLSAPDLPDGEREIFLLKGMDRRKPQHELICPSGCGTARHMPAMNWRARASEQARRRLLPNPRVTPDHTLRLHA